PIANVDSPATILSQDESAGKISSQINSAADDAEEALDGTQVGTVSLNDNILQMTKSDGVDELDGSFLYAAHFQFEDNLLNNSNPEHEGTMVSRNSLTPKSEVYAPGFIGKAAVFDQEERVHIPMIDDMLFTETGTIAFWYKKTYGNTAYLVSRKKIDDPYLFTSIRVGDDGIRWDYDDNILRADDKNYKSLLDQWIYVVVTGDENGTGLYIDGELKDSNDMKMILRDSNDPWYVGGRYEGGYDRYEGLIDELIFDQYKWSAVQIKANYDAMAASIPYEYEQRITENKNNRMEYVSGGHGSSNDYNKTPGTIENRGNWRWKFLYAGNGDCDSWRDRCLDDTLIGLRFTGLPIPANAIINSATIEVTNNKRTGRYNTDEDLEGLIIQMQKQGSDSAPNSINTSLKNLSENRPVFSETVTWEPAPASKYGDHKVKFTSPELKTLLQKAIAEPGWDEDDEDNAVMFLIKKKNANDKGNRLWYSTKSDKNRAPVLRVSWKKPPVTPPPGTGSGGGDGTTTGVEQNQLVGFRFQDVEVPQQATIKSASIEFTAAANASGDALYQVSVEETGNARAFTSTAKLSARPILETIDWDASAQDWNAGSTYSVDVSELVQSAVNQGTLGKTDGWCGGNSMAFFVKAANGGEPLRPAVSYEG
ncbi:LamG-like jellyroll fold domain-containing protein, partial [Candidatus Venteria ishoeyi]|uniref:LamG-like jellyroll fold domain-containing protein n=1 Tax=Candidatus Venteria ishoeyi TaxID=1899563 RepID=UPI0011B0BE12